MSYPSVCLVILDGWGLAEPGPGNAISLADTPVFDELWEKHPHTTLTTHGPAVGLPEGQMGNSEVGHLNLGAGAVVKQDLLRIDEAMADEAVGIGSRIAVLATLATTLTPTTALIRERAAMVGATPEIASEVIAGAFAAAAPHAAASCRMRARRAESSGSVIS